MIFISNCCLPTRLNKLVRDNECPFPFTANIIKFKDYEYLCKNFYDINFNNVEFEYYYDYKYSPDVVEEKMTYIIAKIDNKITVYYPHALEHSHDIEFIKKQYFKRIKRYYDSNEKIQFIYVDIIRDNFDEYSTYELINFFINNPNVKFAFSKNRKKLFLPLKEKLPDNLIFYNGGLEKLSNDIVLETDWTEKS